MKRIYIDTGDLIIKIYPVTSDIYRYKLVVVHKRTRNQGMVYIFKKSKYIPRVLQNKLYEKQIKSEVLKMSKVLISIGGSNFLHTL